MFVETLEAISTAVSVAELSDKTFPTFKRLFKRIKEGELAIAIFGAGGTGKSTLGKYLSGTLENNQLSSGYQESISIEKYTLESNVIGSAIVVPGQERRQDSWDDLLRTISQGKISLIINVVSWGYHSFGELSYQQSSLYKSGITNQEFLEVYTEEHRQEELQALTKITPHLSIADSKKRKILFITLVTKQDLWWNERSKIQDYYQKGEYENKIQTIRNKLGSSNFIHEYCSASLVLENFISGENELLVPTTQGYDERLKFANLRNFLNVIESLCEISLKKKENK
jgi:energy-coupling factor transporter ATP-binding protein EcfA2